MTGHAVREAIRDVLGHFWSESFGQIYPTLAELERHGYVRRQDPDRTRSSTFAITASGTARLKQLLGQPIQPAPPRNGLMLRLFFGRHLGPEACRSLLLDRMMNASTTQHTVRAERPPRRWAAIAAATGFFAIAAFQVALVLGAR